MLRSGRTKLAAALILLPLLMVGTVAGLNANVSESSSQASGKATTLSFHDAMRKLWEDHITWTRLVIVTFNFNTPDLNASLARLLQNQQDIGNAIKPFYGDAAGNQLASLLTSHILIAAQILAADKSGNQTALNSAVTAWYANANDIAVFLNELNPKYFPLDQMESLMRMHLDLTLQEATDELSGNYTASVADYDQVHLEILAMADFLSYGIEQQFPNMFVGPPIAGNAASAVNPMMPFP